MIRVEHIFKSFDDAEILKDIELVFEPGKTNLIIGRSGAGKTVLLKIIVGLLQPSQGKIWYSDHVFFSLNKVEMRRIRMQIGMLFLHLNLEKTIKQLEKSIRMMVRSTL